MKKKYILLTLAAASLLIFTACDDGGSGTGKKTAEPASSAETSAPKKPVGVPSGTYKKIKAVEAQHNDQVEKALEP